jgi:queuine/archaeosine tRNA-ribosyltransferase
MPGTENRLSVTTEPEISRLMMMPTTVVIGISAFDSACFTTTCRFGNPFARAVRI